MSSPAPIVRFAPSPTGLFHLGSARTALFNWMHARKTNGQFLVRIEDTDAERSTIESREQVLGALTLLGLDWDGEVYTSSEHRAEHVEAGARLAAAGLAYWCACSRADIDARGVSVGKGYDGHCREAGLSAAPGLLLRFKHDESSVAFDDAVAGRVEVAGSEVGDFPLIKSTGDPLFVLSNVYDDVRQGVTDVIRGADHLSGTPRYVALHAALRAAGAHDTALPRFAHLPLIMGPSGKKLSKRRDKVSIETYLDEGIVPGALLTMLAGLGWGIPEGMDRASVTELSEYFTLSGVGASNAQFNEEKLRAINADWLRAMGPEELTRAAAPYCAFSLGGLGGLTDELASRISTLREVEALVAPVLADVPTDAASKAKWLTDNPRAAWLLGEFVSRSMELDWTPEALLSLSRELAEESGLNLKKATMPLRVATLRSDRGLPLFEALEVLGRDATYARALSAAAELVALPGE